MANCLVGNNSTSGFDTTSEFSGIDYNLNHDKLLWQLLPSLYREEKVFKYIQSAWQSLKNFHSSVFLSDREKLLREIRITGQRMVLEAWLRDYYGNCDINIINQASELDIMYLYKDGEAGDIEDDTYLFRHSEIGDASTSGFPNTINDQEYILRRDEAIPDTDFVVEIPALIINTGVSTREIEAIIDRYKFMGVTYRIEIT